MKLYPFGLFRLLAVAAVALGLAAKPADQVAARPLAAPTPAVSVSLPAAPFIGDTITINATFSNTVDTGYGPYIDLFLPLSGADGDVGGTNDGISFLSAAFLGAPVTTDVLDCPAGGTVTHPLTGLSVTCPAQPIGLFSPFVWQMVVITLPFGSFVPGQPDATVAITAQVSPDADLNVGLPVMAGGGFMFGADPLDNPTSDPVIQLPVSAVSPVPSPTLITLEKTYNGPEDETATGPNYPRQYTVTATIAPGQTVTSLVLTDDLPDNMQFLTMVTPPNAACTTLPDTLTPTPGGTIVCPVTQVGNTASMTFEYFIPLNDAAASPVIDAISGDDVLSRNNASAVGQWQPLDGRDPLTPVVVDPAGYEHILTDKSIAIQKGVANVTDSVNSPKDILRYTLNFQVSDFFAFEDISITDVISDGQHYYSDATHQPEMSINGNGFTLPAAPMDPGHVDVACNYSGVQGGECDSNDPAPDDGTTSIVFEVSAEIIRLGADSAGRMVGGCVPNAGVGAGNFPDCSAYNDGATTGTITFYTQILEDFIDDYPSGDKSVDQGDILENSVTIDGALLSVEDASTPTGQREADGSGAELSIPYGVISKSIYAINGNTSFPMPPGISPGDTVTYHLTYTLPTSDFEDLVLTDYLPLPIFDATTVNTFTDSVCGVPASGESCYGPNDTYHTLPNTPAPVTPTLTNDGPSNSVTWTYGWYDAPDNQPSQIDLLFTVTVNNEPFADGLYLTNQVHTHEYSTNAGDHHVDGIVQVLLQEPVVHIRKGVVWTDKAGAVFSPATPGPVTFNASGCPAFSGTISSPGLVANPIDSNLAGVDADDRVKMAIVLENSGRNAAFDLKVSDLLPAGLTFVSGTVCVTNGAGTPLTFTGAADDLLTTGIVIDSLGRGKLTDGTVVADGSNIAIITYDVTVDATAEASHVYTNTATLSNYAGVPGGPNHIPDGRTDTATVTPAPPALAKEFVASEINDAHNGNTEVVIGELADYQVVVTLPEGVTPNARIVDTLDAGLAYVGLVSATLSPALSITGSTTPVISNNGHTVTIDLGTVTNSDTDDSVAETITLVYRVVTLNVMGNQSGTLLNNSARLSWTGGSTTVSAPNVTVIEPTVNTTKSVFPTAFDAGDLATFTVTLSNPASASTTAYDVTWSDTIPAGLTYGSGTLALGACSADIPPVLSDATAPLLTASGGRFQPGQSCVITFQATVNYSVSPGQVLTNTAETRWTSMDGPVSGRSSYNTDSNERDGSDGLLNGGALNDYRTQGSANVAINAVAPVKYLVATSEAHTGFVGNREQVTIGEIVRYRLVTMLPEGTSVNFQVRDALPVGMIFLNDNTAKAAFVSNGPGITSANVGTLPVPGITDPNCFISGNSADATTPAIPAACPPLADFNIGSTNSITTNVDIYDTGTNPRFKLGTLTNNDSDLDAEYVIVEFNALVDNTNTGSNDAGENRSNLFRVFINGSQNNGDSNSVVVRVAEPVMSVDKAVSGTPPVDAGDSFTYQVNISNNNTGTPATAFDIVMTDTIDSHLVINSAAITATTQGATCQGGTPYTHSINTSGQDITLNASCLDVGGNITVEINVTVVDTAPSSLTIPNTAHITWTSLPGTHGTTTNPTGSSTPGAPGSDTGERTGDSSGGRTWNDYSAQDVVNVSLADPVSVVKNAPAPTAYTIGEAINYPIVVTLHEGTTLSLRVTDTLPQGLAYLNYHVDASGFNGTLNGTPTVTTVGDPATGPSTTTFDFGDTTVNATPGSGTSSFTIYVAAHVLNIPQNQNGDSRTNSVTAIYVDPDTSSDVTMDGGTQTITIIEPDLNIVKTIVNPPINSVGSPVSYRLVLSHTAASTADAQDVLITDALPNTYLDFTPADNAALTINFTPAACSTAINNSDPATDTVSISIASLPLGCQVEVNFTALLKVAITPGLVVTNTANVGYSTVPGTPPPPQEERTYSDTDSVSFTTNDPDIEKALTGSDAAHTTDPSLTIGETAEYTLTVHIPEGTTNTLQVIDTLPASMAYVSGSAVVAAATTRTGTSIPAPVITEDALNHRVVFDFTGPIVITDSDPLTDDDTFTITLQAVVLNDVANQAGVTLTNTATVQADGGAIISATDDISLVEPDLTISKSVNNPAPTVDEEITFTLDLAHTAASGADALDVVIEDTLPSGLNYVSGSAVMPAGWTFTLNGNVVTFEGDLLLATATAQFTYRAVVDNTTPIGTTLTNTAVTTWTSMPGDPTEQRTGDDGPGGALNDYADQDTASVVFHAVDMAVTKSDDPTTITPSPPAPGVPSVLRYTINYSNLGNIAATNVVITETVPQFSRFNKTTSTGGNTMPPTGWDCADLSPAGTTCNFNIATVPAGGSGTLYFDVVIDESVPANTTEILNTVTIKADEKETDYTNNSDDEDTPLIAAPDMAIEKTDGVTVVSPGVELTYTLTVRNNGNEGATGVVVKDVLPYNVTYVSGSASPPYSSMTTQPNPPNPDQTVITWNVPGEVAAGDVLTFTFRVLVDDPMPAGVTQIDNVATVEDDGTNGPDPTPGDNTTTDTDYLATMPNVNLNKIVNGSSEPSTVPPNVTIGERVLYRVTFIIPPGDLPNMTLSDSLPLGMAFGECVGITSSSPLLTNNLPAQFDTTCNTPAITAEPAGSLEPANQGRNVLFDFGDVTNAGRVDATLTLDYFVYVLDNAENIRGVNLVNHVHWKWGTNNDLETTSTPVTIVEPTLSIPKSGQPHYCGAGDRGHLHAHYCPHPPIGLARL